MFIYIYLLFPFKLIATYSQVFIKLFGRQVFSNFSTFYLKVSTENITYICSSLYINETNHLGLQSFTYSKKNAIGSVGYTVLHQSLRNIPNLNKINLYLSRTIKIYGFIVDVVNYIGFIFIGGYLKVNCICFILLRQGINKSSIFLKEV